MTRGIYVVMRTEYCLKTGMVTMVWSSRDVYRYLHALFRLIIILSYVLENEVKLLQPID